MRVGRRTATATSIALSFVAAGACASAPPAPSPPPAAASPAAGSAAGTSPLVDGAGAYFVFRVSALQDAVRAAPMALAPPSLQLRDMAGLDVVNADNAIILGYDPARSIILSWMIVDGTAMSRLLAAKDPPGRGTPHSVRCEIIVPVLDVARAEAALAQLRLPPDCRRNADGAIYVCASTGRAAVARAHASTREIRVVVAAGDGDLVATASAPLPRASALDARLRRRGFFLPRTHAMFTTPAGQARGLTATGLIKSLAGLAGVDAPSKPLMWQKSARELGAIQRLTDCPPQLFTDFLTIDDAVSWGLTSEGLALFQSLAQARDVPRSLKLAGTFADPMVLSDTIHQAGDGASILAALFLWPQVLTFTSAHPDVPLSFDMVFAAQDATISIDRDQGRLLLRRP